MYVCDVKIARKGEKNKKTRREGESEMINLACYN